VLNKTIEGISKALYEAFGADYTIYIDNVEQDLNTPCFLIKSLNPSQEQRLTNRYERFQPFDIHYFPDAADYTDECMEVTEKLFDVLEYITVGGDLVRGTSMNAEVPDGVLHFFVDFNMFVIKQQERINMNNIQSDVSLKESD
jgi:hypothetical protein